MLGVIVMAVNLLVDVAYGVINPRDIMSAPCIADDPSRSTHDRNAKCCRGAPRGVTAARPAARVLGLFHARITAPSPGSSSSSSFR